MFNGVVDTFLDLCDRKISVPQGLLFVALISGILLAACLHSTREVPSMYVLDRDNPFNERPALVAMSPDNT